jgi:16S rRNA (cytosine1407-C5)-methyltransferase
VKPVYPAFEELAPAHVVELTESVRDRFGIPPEVLDGLRFFRRGKKYLYAASATTPLPDATPIHAIGLPVVRLQHNPPKLSTHGACLWGRSASRNVVELDREQMNEYLQRRVVRLDRVATERCTGHGHVIVRWEGHPVGVGLLDLEKQGAWKLVSLFPKSECVPPGGDAFGIP